MRSVVLVLAGLLLAGCYESGGLLLNPSAAIQPIKTPLDWKYTDDGGTYHATLTPRSDGWYDFQEAKVDSDGSESSAERRTLVLNFLDHVKDVDIYVFGTWNTQESAYMYGLAVLRPDKTWKLLVPNCDTFTARGDWAQTDLDAAIKASAIYPRGQYGCFFSNDLALRQAMRTLVARDDFWQRLDGAKAPHTGWMGLGLF